jgi:hypothetical protein
MEFEAVKPQLHLQNVSLSNFFDKQQEIIGDMIAELNKKKDAIVMHRLKKLGIKVDVEAEQRKRFKSFTVEYNNHEETYWYNDGSETGLRIVTFKKAQPNFDLNKPNYTVKTEVSYY